MGEDDLMVSALVSGLSSLGLSPGWGHCTVFVLGMTLHSHSVSLPPGTDKFNAGLNPDMD